MASDAHADAPESPEGARGSRWRRCGGQARSAAGAPVVEVARRRVTEAEQKLATLNEKLKAAKEATGYERSKQRREAAITAAQEKVDKQKEYIAELEQKATQAEEDAARKLEQEEAKASGGARPRRRTPRATGAKLASYWRPRGHGHAPQARGRLRLQESQE